MRCRRARQRLSELQKQGIDETADPELLAHLQECPRCAHEAHGIEVLSKLLMAASHDDRGGMTPLAEMRRRVERQASENAAAGGVPRDTRRIWRRSIRWAPVAAAAAMTVFLFFAGGFSPSGDHDAQIVGYEVAFAGVQKDLAQDADQICYLLWSLELFDADFDDVYCDTTCRLSIVYLNSEEEASKVIEAFSRMGDGYESAKIIPVTESDGA